MNYQSNKINIQSVEYDEAIYLFPFFWAIAIEYNTKKTYLILLVGFLRPDLRENKVANFGLLDQVAALQWIQENIGEFNGDSNSVTLLGHGTGAASVNILLISPVAQSSSGNQVPLMPIVYSNSYILLHFV